MTSFITDAMVEAALTADMEERAGVNWREVLDDAEQAFEKRIMRAALEAAMKAAWRPVEEAPKDGQTVLVDFGSMGVWAVAWTEGQSDFPLWCVDDNKHGPYYLRGWSEEGDRAPRGWMPLPPTPEAKP